MICRKCGKYNSDGSKVCIYCGNDLEEDKKKNPNFYSGGAWQQPQVQQVESRRLDGALFCLFLWLIGLLIGCLIFGGEERSSFIRGWVLVFGLEVVTILILLLLSCVGVFSAGCLSSIFR